MLFLHARSIIYKLCVDDNVKLDIHSQFSTHNMTWNYFVVCIQLGVLCIFFYKKITKRPLLFIFLKKYKTFGPKWTKCWNPPESGTIFCMSSLFNHWSKLKLFIHFGWTETDNYETCIKKQKLCSQFLLHL